MDWFHDVGAWLFFADIPMSPFSIYGAICCGWLGCYYYNKSKEK